MTFATKISDIFLVVGSRSVVDVIDVRNGRIVHVFETRRDKIRALRMLVSRGGRVFLVAEEEREGVRTVAIICIVLVGEGNI